MLTSSIIRKVNPFINISQIQMIAIRYGHQMSTRNQGGSPKNKHRGFKRYDGEHVEAGQFLFTQRRIKFHPGMYVAIKNNNTLYALVGGKVKISAEWVNLNYENHIVKKEYMNRQGQKFLKKYFNVIPDPQHNRFKLIDVV